MELWRSSESSSGVYLSPADASEFIDLDSTECWSDSEFEDDFDDEDFYGVQEEQDRISRSTNFSSSSEVCFVSVYVSLFAVCFYFRYWKRITREHSRTVCKESLTK